MAALDSAKLCRSSEWNNPMEDGESGGGGGGIQVSFVSTGASAPTPLFLASARVSIEITASCRLQSPCHPQHRLVLPPFEGRSHSLLFLISTPSPNTLQPAESIARTAVLSTCCDGLLRCARKAMNLKCVFMASIVL